MQSLKRMTIRGVQINEKYIRFTYYFGNMTFEGPSFIFQKGFIAKLQQKCAIDNFNFMYCFELFPPWFKGEVSLSWHKNLRRLFLFSWDSESSRISESEITKATNNQRHEYFDKTQIKVHALCFILEWWLWSNCECINCT